jgi:hypothetical protein
VKHIVKLVIALVVLVGVTGCAPVQPAVSRALVESITHGTILWSGDYQPKGAILSAACDKDGNVAIFEVKGKPDNPDVTRLAVLEASCGKAIELDMAYTSAYRDASDARRAELEIKRAAFEAELKK